MFIHHQVLKTIMILNVNLYNDNSCNTNGSRKKIKASMFYRLNLNFCLYKNHNKMSN